MAKLVIKRYATALFELAASEGTLSKYEEEVKVVVSALHNEPDFMAVITDHKVTMEQKVSLVENVFQDKISKPVTGLMVLLIQKGRPAEIIEVLEAFLEMVKTSSGILKATVTSAVALNEQELAAIKANLEASTKSQIELEATVDASIIAGLIIRVGDKIVDASVKGEMQRMKKQLSQLKLA